MRLSTIFQIIKINVIIYLKKILFPNSLIKPYKILFNLTDLCNSRCQFCDIWKIKPKNEINLKDITKSLRGLENDVYWMSFSGGEITLVNYYYDLLDYLKENFKNLKIIAFTTNALAPNKALEYAKYSKKKGFDTLVTISLDGDEKIHDNIRGVRGNYKKCLELKKRLDNENIKAHFGITVSESNSDFIIKKYNDYNTNLKAITFVHSEGIYNKNNSYSYDQQIIDALSSIYKNYKVQKIYEFIEKIHIKISILFLKSGRKKNIITCDSLSSNIHIMPNGKLKPCMFMSECGNIKEQPIIQILKSKIVYDTKKEIKQNKCPKCWMNCYSPHSIMQSPFKSILQLFK